MKRLTLFVLFLVAALVTVVMAQNTSHTGAPAANAAQQGGAPQQIMNSIDAEKIRATVKYLSDDSLEGRGTGQKGGDKAADWIAAQFKSYGLLPAGDNGTYSRA